MQIRLATPDDADRLWEMLTYAAWMPESAADNIDVAKANSELAFYVEDFGKRAGDLGVLAFDAGTLAGAAWLRLSDGVERPMKVATRTEPELAIAVAPGRRGQGVGEKLLASLIERSRGVYPAMVLTARVENPSIRLYQRLGFLVTHELTNRVGSRSVAMRLVL